MKYKSEWNEKNELLSLLIFKQLQLQSFPRGLQMRLCKEMGKITNLEATNISAKISNYKSVAGINNHSNASKITIQFYNKYKTTTIEEIQKIIDEY